MLRLEIDEEEDPPSHPERQTKPFITSCAEIDGSQLPLPQLLHLHFLFLLLVLGRSPGISASQ